MHTNYGEVCKKMRYLTQQYLKTVQNKSKMFRQMLHCTQKHFRSEQKHAKVCSYDKFVSTKSLQISSCSAHFLPSTTTTTLQRQSLNTPWSWSARSPSKTFGIWCSKKTRAEKKNETSKSQSYQTFFFVKRRFFLFFFCC